MNVSEFINNITDLPTLPTVAIQINQEIKNDNLTAKSLGEIVHNDPALTSRVLRLANSAYYGLVSRIDTLDRAITVLGINTLKNLALTISVFKVFHDNKHQNIDMEALWHHCLGCAVASKAIVAHTDPALAEQAFLSGIIHDIGKIAIAHAMPDKMAEIIDNLQNTDSTESEIENKVLGFTHQNVGSLLADKWKFPIQYCKAIKFHHTPYSLEPPPFINREESILISSVYVGNQIAKAMSFGASTDPKAMKIDHEMWLSLDIDREQISGFRDQIKEDYEIISSEWELE
jgi:HD-like signal output (HDOD) protein